MIAYMEWVITQITTHMDTHNIILHNINKSPVG